MGHSFASAACSDEGPDGDLLVAGRSPNRDLLALVNRAVADCGYSHEALAVALAKDRGYITKVLNADKPLGVGFLMALPEDVGARFAQLHAESFGQIVVLPARGEDALRQFAAGLIGIFTQQATALRKPMAKATLPAQAKTRTA